MSTLGSVDIPLELFSGLVTDMPPQDLPPGVSPNCRDVIFPLGAVRTRPGLLSVYAAIAGNPTVNYVKTFQDLQNNLRTLFLDSAGTLWQEFPQGTVSSIGSPVAPNSYAKSDTLFGREYIAFSDGKFGVDIPRQYDTAQLDRVSQVGPGALGPAAVSVADAVFAGVNIAAAPTGAVRDATGAMVTITTSSAHGLTTGVAAGYYTITIAGVTDSSFNGTFPVQSVPTSTTFTYAQSGTPNATSGNGTATVAGNIPPGVHQVSLIFVTRQGYLTAPSPPLKWTATGNRQVTISRSSGGLGVYPQNITEVIFCFTAAGGASFYYTGAGSPLFNGNMIVPIASPGATSLSSVTLDFSDSNLLLATNVDSLFRNVELGECLGCIGYANRLFWWGERNHMNNWLNLTFDGGFDGFQLVPFGWKADASFGAGGTADQTNVVWGTAYRITGDGATATRGKITQLAQFDTNGVPLIAANTSYSVRARVMKGGGLAQGTLHINLFSASAGINTTGLQVTAAQAGTSYAEFNAVLTAPINGVIPADLLLQVFADGTPTNSGYFIVDNIEIYPTSQPSNGSNVRVCTVNNPDTYDALNGLIQVSENDGTNIRAAFKFRENLYFVKERSLHVTSDDGVNEPAKWNLSEVSRVVGTPSANGVAYGEDWVVIANRQGLYLFWGGEPVKISQEIQPTWDAINWQYGHTLWTMVDTRNKRILIGAPVGSATSPNQILVLDYRGLVTADDIASHWSVHYSAYTGKVLALGDSRKWCPWFITANAGALIERADGTAQVFLGNGAGNGKVYQLSPTQLSDDGVAVNSFYQAYFSPAHSEEQALQLTSHRKLYQYLTLFAEGAGTLNVTAFSPGNTLAYTLPSLTLVNPGAKDLEMMINILAERASFQVATNGAGQWFQLGKLVVAIKPDPWMPVRGMN